MAKLNLRWAVNQALDEEMARDDKVLLLGEDIAGAGGSFGETRGLLGKYGEWRVRDTPISEEGITGVAVGLALKGYRPVVEIMFMDFITLAFDAITNQAGQTFYLSGGKINVPMVIRTIAGAGFFSGAHHSQTLEGLFMHMPGVKVVYPSNPADAKGLLKASIRDDNPVLFIEPKAYLGLKGEVPEGEHIVPIGKANILREGHDVTLVGYGRMLQNALDAAKVLESEGIDTEVIDLRTIVPWDRETVFASVRKTSRVGIVCEDRKTCGVAAELAATIAEELIAELDAPIRRFAAADLPIPVGEVERYLFPSVEDIVTGVKEMF